MSTWVVLAVIGLGTYVLRVAMFLVADGKGLPSRLDDVLSMVAPAAVAALLGAILFTADGRIDAVPVPQLLAVAVGYLAVRLGGSVLLAFALGLPTLWALTWLGL